MPDEKPTVPELDTRDAMGMLGNGYEIHPPAVVLQEGEGGFPEERTDDAWIKLSMSFLRIMRKLRGAKLAIWLAIALRIDEKYSSYPSIKTIQADSGLSNKEVIDTVRELEDMGFLTVRRKGGRHNIYRVNSFAAYGSSEPVLPTSVESSPVNFSTKPVNFSSKPVEATTHEQEEQEGNKKDIVDGIIDFHLRPKALQDALREFFKLTPNWEAKSNRQFMQWALAENMTPEQIERAADLWRRDKRFNWATPSLKGIQEHWLELIASDEKESEFKTL